MYNPRRKRIIGSLVFDLVSGTAPISPLRPPGADPPEGFAGVTDGLSRFGTTAGPPRTAKAAGEADGRALDLNKRR